MKNLKKMIALMCASGIMTASIFSCICIQPQQVLAAPPDEDVAVIEEVVGELGGTDFANHSNRAGKEETVYALLDADGNVTKTIVSEWLKNANGADTLSDISDLTDIQVVKGDSKMLSDSENQITWATQGGDVYYQGYAEKELPIKVHIHYELDGKAVTADALKGANGHLKIKFTYENNTAKEITLQGESATIYQPFAFVSGVVLDDDKAVNVTVDNGNILNSGDNCVVFGIAMPGLKESLGIDHPEDDNGDPIDIDIPEEVVIEADVNDFSMLMSLTVATNTALDKLGLDDISTIDDLKDDMHDLQDGMDQILDGTGQLQDGAGKLSDGVKEDLSDGVDKLSDGTSELSKGARELSDGAGQIDQGADQLKNGLAELKAKTPDLSNGVEQLASGSQALASGFAEYSGKESPLNAGAAALSNGLSRMNAQFSEETMQKLEQLSAGNEQMKNGLAQLDSTVKAAIAASNTELSDEQKAQIAQLQQAITTLTAYSENLKASGVESNVQIAVCIDALIAGYQQTMNEVSAKTESTLAQMGQISDAISTISTSYAGDGSTDHPGIYGGINSAVSSLNAVKDGVAQLAPGAATLQDGIYTYTNTVSEKTTELSDGISRLQANIPALVDGVYALSEGADKLAQGTGELSTGAKELSNGADQLDDGSRKLKSGVSDLVKGTADLVDGTGQLRDGVITFNDEGISKLSATVNDDLDRYFERLKNVQDYAKEYTSFAGVPENIESSVKFIFKSDSIE